MKKEIFTSKQFNRGVISCCFPFVPPAAAVGSEMKPVLMRPTKYPCCSHCLAAVQCIKGELKV